MQTAVLLLRPTSALILACALAACGGGDSGGGGGLGAAAIGSTPTASQKTDAQTPSTASDPADVRYAP